MRAKTVDLRPEISRVGQAEKKMPQQKERGLDFLAGRTLTLGPMERLAPKPGHDSLEVGTRADGC